MARPLLFIFRKFHIPSPEPGGGVPHTRTTPPGFSFSPRKAVSWRSERWKGRSGVSWQGICSVLRRESGGGALQGIFPREAGENGIGRRWFPALGGEQILRIGGPRGIRVDKEDLALLGPALESYLAEF